MSDHPHKDPKTGQFLQGFSGNPKGRPKGARTKLGEAFIEDMYADWAEHGAQTIADVREDRPDVYLKVVASILPRDVNLNVNAMDDVTDDELVQRIRELDATIRPFLDTQGEAGSSEGTGTPTAH